MAANLTSETDLASEILVLAGQDPAAFEPTGDSDEVFRRASRKQLLDCAQRLGLKGISKLPKEELAGRVLVAFQELPRSKAGPPGIIPSGTGALASPVIVKGSAGDIPINGESSSEDVAGTFARKFDLGRTEAPPVPENIPWGYDQDRVTAMVVDPDRLYVYWEVTDSAIDRVRPQLGTAGTDAWLNLRVYDITGRLFDGTNAHSYFDHRLERYDRQWFFAINKPTSTACVEVGLMSS